MDITSRLKLLEGVDEFINDKTKMLTTILSKLSWTDESLVQEAKVQCPLNSGHWVSESHLSEHAELCAWTKEGHLKEEKEKQPPSSKFFYKNATSVVPFVIDKETLASIISENKGVSEIESEKPVPDIPLTIDRCTVEMTPQQRLDVYDYVVSASKALNKPSNVKMEDLLFDFEKKNEDDKPKTELEILAEQRDYKRRRQSYRAKNVHITKKSYTEVMKEVIENQITYLAESRKQEESERNMEDSDSSSSKDFIASTVAKRTTEDTVMSCDTKDNPHHHRSRRSRSRSRSQERSRHKRKKSRSRSRSRHKHKKSHHKKHKKSH